MQRITNNCTVDIKRRQILKHDAECIVLIMYGVLATHPSHGRNIFTTTNNSFSIVTQVG